MLILNANRKLYVGSLATPYNRTYLPLKVKFNITQTLKAYMYISGSSRSVQGHIWSHFMSERNQVRA